MSNTIKKFYTILGDEKSVDKEGYPISDSDSDCKCLAKSETRGESTKYFIRMNDIGEPENPIDVFEGNKHIKHKFLDKDKLWQFRQVSVQAFNQYKEFLKTKNIRYYKYTKRELI